MSPTLTDFCAVRSSRPAQQILRLPELVRIACGIDPSEAS
jgi:hypothetical protein